MPYEGISRRKKGVANAALPSSNSMSIGRLVTQVRNASNDASLEKVVHADEVLLGGI